MEKIQQYKTTIRCQCPGRPSGVPDTVVRTKCERVVDVVVVEMSPKRQQVELHKGLQAEGWKRLRTLGVYQRLCPSCSKFVLEQRARNKLKWG